MNPSRWRNVIGIACFVWAGTWTHQAHSSPQAALATTRPAAARRLDPEVVRPPPGSAREEALSARSQWRWVRARSVAEGALPEATPEEQPRLRWIASMAARNVQDDLAAEALLLPVAESEGALARHAKVRLAGWILGREPARALTLIDSVLAELDGAPRAWPLTRHTERLRARALARLERTPEAIEALRALRTKQDEPMVVSELADLLASQPEEPALLEALALYRELSHRWPTRRQGRAAVEQAETLLAGLPKATREGVPGVSLALRQAHAEALLDSFRYLEARDAYAALLAETQQDTALHCQIRFGQAKALIKARQRSEGAPLMAAVADTCTEDADQRAWARYYAGRAFSAAGDNEPALVQYALLEQEAPTHRLADDALWRSAKVAYEMGDEAAAEARLKLLPERYPEGDMGPQARFALGWQAREDGKLEEALAHFDKLMSVASREPREDMHGRADYWRGRVLVQLGRKREAVQAYAALVRQWPLTYHGQLARARLLDLDPARAEQLRKRLGHEASRPLSFAWRGDFESQDFARALELMRVGEMGMAQSELLSLGLMGERADEDALWLSSTLLDRAGAHDDAVGLVRGPLGESLLQKIPSGRDWSFWKVAYPNAFAPLIEQTARRFDVPAPFVRAVAREESNFNPAAVSPAHAYGLIQLILPTAEAVAKGLGMRVNSQSLRRPEVNLPVGTRFISGLSQRYHGQYALVPAAYNAGPAAAGRWLEERGDQDLDEWIENIPYDETRHYSRRVLQSYGIYAWLSSGELPRWPLSLPAL